MKMINYYHPSATKPFHMSYRRLLCYIFTVLTAINIVSMIATTSFHFNRITAKEEMEKHALVNLTIHSASSKSFEVIRQHPSYPLTNKDAYAVVKFLNLISLFVGIAIRCLGLVAVGVCGKEFSDIEYESSDKRESFSGSLAYTCAMIILIAAYYVGIVRMATHDLVIHYILTIIGAVFVGFALQPRENYSKELNTLPI